MAAVRPEPLEQRDDLSEDENATLTPELPPLTQDVINDIPVPKDKPESLPGVWREVTRHIDLAKNDRKRGEAGRRAAGKYDGQAVPRVVVARQALTALHPI
jgi:hypothetical protein